MTSTRFINEVLRAVKAEGEDKMSHLEDTLTKILEMRASGKKIEEIERTLDINRSVIEFYEKNLSGYIGSHASMGLSLDDIAEKSRLSPVLIGAWAEFYGSSPDSALEERREFVPYGQRKKRNVELVGKYSEEGKTDVEIAKLLGLAERTVVGYRSLAGVKRAYEGEDRTEQVGLIKTRLEEGKSVKEIAEELNCSTHRVYNITSKFEIDIREIRKKQKSERTELVKSRLEGGKSIEEVAEELGLPSNRIYRTAQMSGVIAKRREARRKYMAEQIQNRLEEGKSIEVIAAELDCTRQSVYQIASASGIGIRRFNEKRREERMGLIKSYLEEGKSIGEIAAELELSKGHVRGIVNEAGINLRNFQRRQTKEEELLSGIASIIGNAALQKAYEHGWAYGKAMEYELGVKKKVKEGNKSRNYTSEERFPMLLRLFESYENAAEKREKPSLEQLAEDSGFSFTNVGRILKRVGLEPFYGTRERVPPSHEQNDAMERACGLEMSSADIAYFIGVPFYIVSQALIREGIKKKRFPPIKSFGNGPALTYRLASQIYKAQDSGFKEKEIAELLELDSRVVDYALRHWLVIEPKITNALQTLYSDRGFDKPYK